MAGTNGTTNENVATFGTVPRSESGKNLTRCPESCCGYCGMPLPQGMGRPRRYCTGAHKKAAYRRNAVLASRPVAKQPCCHFGAFQAYQSLYAGKVDVIITDPPYARDGLPVYHALAAFARAVLKPGGWLLCLTGFGIDYEVRTCLNASGLDYITVCTYLMPGATGHGEKRLTTGRRRWNQQAKPLLWYEQPGTRYDRRRAGTSDLIQGHKAGKPDVDRVNGFHWQQSLEAFQQIVWQFTNPQDVLCDPCMGSGTTLLAAIQQRRFTVIGIEKDAAAFQQAVQRVETVYPACHGAAIETRPR